MRALLAAAVVLAALSSARGIELPAKAVDQILDDLGRPASVSTPDVPAVSGKPVLIPGQEDDTLLPPEEQQTNFQYGEISNRLKKLVIGRGKKRMAARKVNGVTVADRVDGKGIKYIVIHSAMGGCAGAINQMETHHASAHFIVCKDGSVTRLVDIKNITLHVKNETVNDASVGIETETGETVSVAVPGKRGRVRHELESDFTAADWDPAARWRMYSSLAWLIRAVADETGVPRIWGAGGSALSPGVFGHLDADKGIPDGHTDPGPYFYNQSYPDFDLRFPGQGMTPQKFLMLLVAADQPPRIKRVAAGAGTSLRVSDVARAGLAKVVMSPAAAGAKPLWSVVSDQNQFPPADLGVDEPNAPGSYRIDAYDLVGNHTAALFTVGPPAPNEQHAEEMGLQVLPQSAL